MFKILTAALLAAGIAIAPIASTAQAAQPATKTVTTTTKVVKLKGHKRHFARHHKRIKAVKHVRGHKVIVIKKTGKLVKPHQRNHVAVKAVKVRTN
jgi:ferredoxin-NADP reductase